MINVMINPGSRSKSRSFFIERQYAVSLCPSRCGIVLCGASLCIYGVFLLRVGSRPSPVKASHFFRVGSAILPACLAAFLSVGLMPGSGFLPGLLGIGRIPSLAGQLYPIWVGVLPRLCGHRCAIDARATTGPSIRNVPPLARLTGEIKPEAKLFCLCSFHYLTMHLSARYQWARSASACAPRHRQRLAASFPGGGPR